MPRQTQNLPVERIFSKAARYPFGGEGNAIEEAFRDMKSRHFGEGLERSRSSGTGRFTVLVLIASLAAFLVWLPGTAAETLGFEKRMRPGSPKRRAYSRLFLARLILTIESWRPVPAEILAAVGDADLWVSSHHDALVLD